MANQNHQQTVCCPFTLLPPHSTLLLEQHPPLLFHKENEACQVFSFLISKAHASVPPLDGLFYLSKVSWQGEGGFTSISSLPCVFNVFLLYPHILSTVSTLFPGFCLRPAKIFRQCLPVITSYCSTQTHFDDIN